MLNPECSVKERESEKEKGQGRERSEADGHAERLNARVGSGGQWTLEELTSRDRN